MGFIKLQKDIGFWSNMWKEGGYYTTVCLCKLADVYFIRVRPDVERGLRGARYEKTRSVQRKGVQ